jgi:hypothetical protein
VEEVEGGGAGTMHPRAGGGGGDTGLDATASGDVSAGGASARDRGAEGR